MMWVGHTDQRSAPWTTARKRTVSDRYAVTSKQRKGHGYVPRRRDCRGGTSLRMGGGQANQCRLRHESSASTSVVVAAGRLSSCGG